MIGQANGINGLGVSGQGVGVGVSGDGALGVRGNGNLGVEGNGSGNGSVGVYGNGEVGVQGNGNVAVRGNGFSIGVYGFSSFGGVGVRGDSNSSSSNNPGVWGQNTAGGPAIVGFSPSGVGFTAVTVSGTGCFGGASGSGTGVFAYSGTSTALVAQAAGAGALAGYFSGPVYITGSLTVLGAKSAAVKGVDGSLRRMYSLESPESWFEDFGKGELKGGTVTVPLASDFAGVVHGDNYHVFLTPRGESSGWLYVSKQSPNGFTVQEAGGGTGNVGFSYRVVAKRKDPVPCAVTYDLAASSFVEH